MHIHVCTFTLKTWNLHFENITLYFIDMCIYLFIKTTCQLSAKHLTNTHQCIHVQSIGKVFKTLVLFSAVECLEYSYSKWKQYCTLNKYCILISTICQVNVLYHKRILLWNAICDATYQTDKKWHFQYYINPFPMSKKNLGVQYDLLY